MKKFILIFLLITGTTFAANGELQISSHSVMPRVVPREGINIPLLSIDLTAKNEDIAIEKLVFQRTGLSDSQDIDSIRAIGKNVSSRNFPVLTNDKASITFFGKWVIPKRTTETIIITANLKVQGTGRTIELNLVDVVSSATINTLQAPTQKTLSKTSPRMEASSFRESNITIEKIPFSISRLRLGHWQKMGRFRFTNDGEKAIPLDSLYMKNTGIDSFQNIFEDVILTSRNKVISKIGTFSDKTARFPFLPNTNIEANSNLLLEVWGNIRRNKSTFSVNFEAKNSDLIVR